MLWIGLILVALTGGMWRRWWGDSRPTWLPPKGYRGIQFAIGMTWLALVLLLVTKWWVAIGLGLAATTFMSLPIAISRRPFEYPWVWIDTNWGTPRWGRWFTGWTTYAEFTEGMAVYAVAYGLGMAARWML